MRNLLFYALVIICGLYSCKPQQKNTATAPLSAAADTLRNADETHLFNVRQLTFGGENAEAYWSFKGHMLTYQAHNRKDSGTCDQIFYGDVDRFLHDKDKGGSPAFGKMVSTNRGRTTCSWFMPGDKQIIYASTHLYGDTCPADPPHVRGKYLWAIYPEYEIFVADLNGKIVKQLSSNKFYDAEATVSPKGDKIIFTSDRSGDLELYTMNLDGSDVKQITNQPGYDGGACFSPDGKEIIWRASRFDTEAELAEYKENLKKHLVSPMKMELFIANADGSNRRQIGNLGGANWAPCFHPSGKKILFSSNHKTKSIPFNLYMINTDGTGLQQISSDKVFDAFAMFSLDGKKLAWCSNRNNGGTRETNIFVADWKE